jgi:quercetin dioxygenase-like cupin family protein
VRPRWIKGIEFVAHYSELGSGYGGYNQDQNSSPTDSPSEPQGGNAMKRWHLPTLDGSSDKRNEREAGADAPRVPSVGAQKPRVLFSSPECRLVALDLGAGEALPDHHVRERAVVQVISGRVAIDASGETVECEAGTLVTFDPGERHALRGLDPARLLLMLAPWPAVGHDSPTEQPHDQHLPANATVEPITRRPPPR